MIRRALVATLVAAIAMTVMVAAPARATVTGGGGGATPTSQSTPPSGTPPSVGGGISVSCDKPDASQRSSKNHGSEDDGFPWIWVVVAVVVLGIAGLVVVLVRRTPERRQT
jgi:hypothetical protein